jgi:hypothetical protein
MSFELNYISAGDFLDPLSATTTGNSTNFIWPLAIKTLSNESASSNDLPSTKFASESIEILRDEDIDSSALAQAKLQKQPDTVYVRFKLAHVGANKNRDGFKKKDLKSRAKTIVNKPLDWEHSEPIIGTIYSAKFIDMGESSKAGKNGDRDHVLVEAAIWKTRNKEEVEEVLERYNDGTLAFSMEAYFSECECSVCGSKFKSKANRDGSYCEHLNSRLDASSGGATRYLTNFFFGAASVVESPADVDALPEAVLAKNREGVETNLKTYTEEEVKAMESKAVENFKKSLDEKDLVAENDSLKASIVVKDGMIVEKDAKIAELSGSNETLVKENLELKNSVALEALKSKRLAQLEEVGYKLPDDEGEKEKKIQILMAMDENTFAFHVDELKSLLDVKRDDDEDEDEEDDADAKAVKATAKKKEIKKVPTGSTTKASTKKSVAEELADLIIRS